MGVDLHRCRPHESVHGLGKGGVRCHVRRQPPREVARTDLKPRACDAHGWMAHHHEACRWFGKPAQRRLGVDALPQVGRKSVPARPKRAKEPELDARARRLGHQAERDADVGLHGGKHKRPRVHHQVGQRSVKRAAPLVPPVPAIARVGHPWRQENARRVLKKASLGLACGSRLRR